jgi:signal transduction histidine kinase
MALPTVRPALRTGVPGSLTQAKLDLLEAFLSPRADVLACAQLACEWLARHAGVARSLCAVLDSTRTNLIGLAGHGLAVDAIEGFSISIEERRHPLVSVLGRVEPLFFKTARNSAGERVPETPFGSQAFAAISLGVGRTAENPGIGLMLVSPAPATLGPETRWLCDAFGQKLDQLWIRGNLADDERRFRRERTLLHGIIDAVTDPILLTDTEGRLLVANDRAEALFSAGDDVTEGRRRAVELNNMFFSAALSRSAVEDVGLRRELLLVDPIDGSDMLFELLSTVVDDPREGTGIVSILRNVTDLRRATEQIEENYAKLRVAEAESRAERDRLNVIIDSVADPILVTDDEGNISLMNAPAEKLFTVDPYGGDGAERAVRANDAHFSSFLSGLLSSGEETRRTGEIGLTDPSTGQPVPYEAIAGKIVTDLGELSAVVTILHDRTEAIEKAQLFDQLKLASEQLEVRIQEATAELARQNELLRRQAIELEQASTAKSHFLANMSHELRTPLNAILGYGSMLLQGVSGDLNPAQRKNIARIDSNGRHLLSIINEILDITRIESGRMPLQVSEFKFADLVKEVTSELEPIIARSGLTVSTRLPATLPLIRSDRQKVKQIVLNLLSNALKFTHKGSVTIRGSYSDKDKTMAIAVIDTGIGIAKQDQEKIFEDFRQVDNTPTRAYDGTGLGLSICRRLAAMLKGAITVESEVGKGSTFTLLIPARFKK